MVVGGLLLALLQPIPLQASEMQKHPYLQPARDFSADLIFYNRHHPGLQQRSRVWVSKTGIRTVTYSPRTGKPAFIYIQNFRTEQAWIAAPEKLYFAVLPDVDTPDDGIQESMDDSTPPPGILASKPCAGLVAEKLDERKVKQTTLTAWKCTDVQDGKVWLQHYSSLLGAVVRQESGEGEIFELREIKLEEPDEQKFVPSSLWRAVTLEEFFTGVPSLPVYEEPKN